jgi:hypothetical protein
LEDVKDLSESSAVVIALLKYTATTNNQKNIVITLFIEISPMNYGYTMIQIVNIYFYVSQKKAKIN